MVVEGIIPVEGGGGRLLGRVLGTVVAVAFAQWFLQRSSGHPIVSVFGLVGVVAAFVIALTSLDRQDYRDLLKLFVQAFRLAGRQARKGTPQNLNLRMPATVLSGLLIASLLVASGLVGYRHFFRGNDDQVCPHPTELKVLASSEGAPAARVLLSQYELSTVDTNQCPAVHGFVEPADRADLIRAVAHGWQADKMFDPATVVGSRPDLWLADSTIDVRDVLELAKYAKKSLPVVASESIGSSPMVIVSGIPISGLAEGASWSAVVAAAMSQGIGLLTADPQASVDGLLATASYLRHGNTSTVSLPQARRLAQTVHASGMVARDDAGTAICRFRTADVTNLAVITSEQLWLRYGQTSQLAGACAGKAPSRLGGSMVRPTDSLVLDHPFVQFDWNTQRRRSTVDEFRRWLATTAGQRAVASAGLDSARPDCSGTLDLDAEPDAIKTDVTPERGVARDPCVPVDVDELHQLYESVQQPGVVLLELDTSGSMNDRTNGGSSRLAAATDAVVHALGQIGPEDQFGIWTFSGEKPAHKQIAAIGPGSIVRRDKAVDALRKVPAAGSTPLYRSILDGLAKVASTGSGKQQRAVVVVTDGQDTSSRVSAADTVSQIRRTSDRSGVGLFIIATGEATCEGAGGLKVLTDAGRGECFESSMAQIPTVTGKLFESLWKGR